MTPFASPKTLSYGKVRSSPATVSYKFYCTECKQWGRINQRPDRGDLATCEHCGARTEITGIVVEG